MKRTMSFLIIGLVITIVVACGPRPDAPTADTQATIDAAVAATSTVQANMQATIDAAVEATNAAISTPTSPNNTVDVQATVSAAVQATMAAAPTALPAEAYVTLMEEEMAALIDEAIVEATTATEEYSEDAADVASDGVITYEELIALLIYLEDAEQMIAYAEELVNAYYDLYGELATETLALLQAMEQDLLALAETAAAVYDALWEIYGVLEQGLTLTEETVEQLETAAQAALDKAAAMEGAYQDWIQTLQAELEARAAQALTLTPNQSATDRITALQMAFDYIDAVHEALADNRLSQAELANIAQLGANASVGLSAYGGPQLQQLAGKVDEITGQLARGQVPQAQAALGTLENSLGSRPARP